MELVANPAPAVYNSWVDAQPLYSVVLSAAEKKKYFLQQSYSGSGGQSAAGCLHNLYLGIYILLILKQCPHFIVFTQLYIASKTQATSLEMALFLQDCLFPQVSASERASLNSPITIEELGGIKKRDKKILSIRVPPLLIRNHF